MMCCFVAFQFARYLREAGPGPILEALAERVKLFSNHSFAQDVDSIATVQFKVVTTSKYVRY